jgi:hypothetical protein
MIYFLTIFNILRLFGIFYGHFVVIWYIGFSTFWYVVPRKIWQPRLALIFSVTSHRRCLQASTLKAKQVQDTEYQCGDASAESLQLKVALDKNGHANRQLRIDSCKSTA